MCLRLGQRAHASSLHEWLWRIWAKKAEKRTIQHDIHIKKNLIFHSEKRHSSALSITFEAPRVAGADAGTDLGVEAGWIWCPGMNFHAFSAPKLRMFKTEALGSVSILGIFDIGMKGIFVTMFQDNPGLERS